MAKALKCNDCGKLLASVREAQDHNEITGHANFEETTAEIKVMKCTECGKPCRSDAEKTLHSRHTGHATFVDAALDAPINTEQQMADARVAMETDDDLVAAALKKKKAADSGAGAAVAGSSGAGAAAGASGEAGPSGEAGASTSGANMVEPQVDENIVKELTENLGFSRNRAVRAAYHSGGGSIDNAVNWLMDHEGDKDIDTPLMVTQASEDAASKLTPEERKKKAQDLIKAVKEKREKEERELAAHRERERIRAGKEMLAAKKKDDELAMKRIVEQRRLEKEEEARAREKARARVEEDRRERRRKLGLPEELTEEEKAREAEKAAKAAAAAKEAEDKKKSVFGHVKPAGVLEKLRDCARGMKKTHATDEETWRTAGATLTKYIANVASNPGEEKFRSIKKSNAAFQSRVAKAAGGVEFLELCGFVLQADGDTMHLPADKVNLEVLGGAHAALQDMLTNPFFGAL